MDRCLQTALALIDCEIKLVFLRVNPQQTAYTPRRATFSNRISKDLPEIFWDSKHPKTYLSELLYALYLLGVFRHNDGSKLYFTEIIAHAEHSLSLKIGDSRELRRTIVRRKNKKTPFLDMLCNKLNEENVNNMP